jgi:predicted alpha/beta superfamily hydrolase
MQISLKCYPEMRMRGLLPRDVWVWTPPQYHQNLDVGFPVIYMHDGQNLFFPERSYAKATWGVAEIISKLSGWGFIQPAIVVGIDNTENRFGDYLPTKPFETGAGKAFIAQLEKSSSGEMDLDSFVADLYLKLIVRKIKPIIDRDFRTLEKPEQTFVMGSSMGGLISLYALVEYPEIFGGAGCLSTHWTTTASLMPPYLQENLPGSGRHKIYFDYGMQELEADYGPFQEVVDAVMIEKGYQMGKDWLTRVFPGAKHHENDWRRRLHLPLRFLLGLK